MLTTSALVLALAVPCWAQGRQLPTDTTTVAGTIETIDQNTRAMNIRTADGKFVAVTVPESVKRFHELKAGDMKATYNNNVNVRLKPPGEPAIDTAGTAYSNKGVASGTQGMVRMMTASVVAIDRGASSISFEGPNGWKYSRRVVDPTVFNQIKVGDRVDITWNTDLTVSVIERSRASATDSSRRPGPKPGRSRGWPLADDQLRVSAIPVEEFEVALGRKGRAAQRLGSAFCRGFALRLGSRCGCDNSRIFHRGNLRGFLRRGFLRAV
jgi:hypothetical protein